MRGRLRCADILRLVEATALGSDDERGERLRAELRDALPLKVCLGGKARRVDPPSARTTSTNSSQEGNSCRLG